MNLLYFRFTLLLVMALGIVGAATGFGNPGSPSLGHQPAACTQQALAGCPEPDPRLRARVHDAGQIHQLDGERQARRIAVRRILPGVLR